jgi:hypothetical protein
MPIRAADLKVGHVIELLGVPGLSDQNRAWAYDWYAPVLSATPVSGGTYIVFTQSGVATPKFQPIIVPEDYMFNLSTDLPQEPFDSGHKGEYDLEFDVDRAIENAFSDGKFGYPSDRLKGRHNTGLAEFAMWEWELMHGFVASERYDRLWGGNQVKKYSGFYGEGED